VGDKPRRPIAFGDFVNRKPLEMTFAAALISLWSACGGSTPGNDVLPNDRGPAALCSSSRPCPNNQFCFNGLCAYGCTSNAHCASDQYCNTEGDRTCHNKTVATCPETACAENQACTNGFCSTPVPSSPGSTGCDPQKVVTGNDGCDKSSICIAQESTSKCYQFPACAEDKTCPTGTQGAVCHTGELPNKGNICLIGLCKQNAHCPSSWNCVRGSAADVFGVCSNGSTGSLCSDSGQCLSLNCMKVGSGLPGMCL
jgi:hypothetical protein